MESRKHGLGALPSPVDSRDWGIQAVLGTYPKRVLLKAAGAYDQGEYGTCVMQVIKRCMEGRWNKNMGIFVPYGRWRSHPLYGMYPNEAYNWLVKEGAAPAAALYEKPCEMPEAREQANRLSAQFVSAAAPFAGGSWHRLHTVAEIKASLMQIKALEDKGIMGAGIGFCFPASSYQPDEFNVWPAHDAENGGMLLGLHWMYIAGYEPHGTFPFGREVEMVKVLNSWGEEWGDRGFCWITWDDVLKQDDIIAYFPDYEQAPEDPIVRRRTLRKGMKGEDVKEMQRLLEAHGYGEGLLPYGADGDFGSKTEGTLRTFQRAERLSVDGICGPQSWAALDAAPKPGPEPEPEPKPESGRMARFFSFLFEQEGQIYVWGGNGQPMTEALIRRMETTAKNASRAIALYRKRLAEGRSPVLGYDCSGLISRFLQNEGLVKAKRNSRHLWAFCEPIKRGELRPGDLVFRHNGIRIYHVGVYIGDGLAIEAKGRDDGVVIRTLSASGENYWNRFGRLDMLHE